MSMTFKVLFWLVLEHALDGLVLFFICCLFLVEVFLSVWFNKTALSCTCAEGAFHVNAWFCYDMI